MQSDKLKIKFKNLDGYVLTPFLLGNGAFAQVFLCYKEGEDKNKTFYAAKTFKKDSLDKCFLELLHKEIKILTLLKHNNIMKLITTIETKNNYYVILEYCDSENLEDFLSNYKKKFNTLPSAKLVRHILEQLASGLKHIHSYRFIHRDLKLDNIMITFSNEKLKLVQEKFKLGSAFKNRKSILDIALKSTREDSLTININLKDNERNYFYYDETIIDNKDYFEEIMLLSEIKIIDFGLSNNVDKNGCAKTICGNIDTCPPEIVDNLHNKSDNFKYDKTVDIWAFGCIALYLSEGEFPFALEDNNVEGLQKRLELGQYLISLKSNTLSFEYVDLITRLLQKDNINRVNMDQIFNHFYFQSPLQNHHLIDIKEINEEFLDKNREYIVLNINKKININSIVNKKNFIKVNEIDSEIFLNYFQTYKKLSEQSQIVVDDINVKWEVVSPSSQAIDFLSDCELI